MRLDDPKSDQIRNLKRLPRNLAAASPLGYTSVSKGQTQFRGAHSLTVIGSADIDGTLFITGILNGNGQLIWSGSIALTGTQTVSGTGKIVIGTMTFDTGGIYGGRVTAGTFQVNGKLEVTSSTVLAAAVAVNAALTATGTTTLTGLLINTGMTSFSAAANVYVDASTKRFYLATSASRFKLDPQAMDLDDRLLDIPVEWWIDRGAAERYAELLEAPRPFTAEQDAEWHATQSLVRIPGVIAEKVVEFGGSAFVTFDDDGQVLTVQYDRLALARTQVLDQKKADRSELAELDERVRELEELVRKLSGGAE